MGWTTTSDYALHWKGVISIREYLDRQFACDHPDFPRYEVLASSMVDCCEYYAAIRSTDRKIGESAVWALIAMVSHKSNAPDGYTLGWKEMCETSGPYCHRCPERILALLDPIDNAYALEWRRSCRETRARKAEARCALTHGAVIEFAEPLHFSGGVARARFTVEKHGHRLRFRGMDGVLCRIPKAAERDFRVIKSA